ncbi:hypothetical protein [Methylobacterium oxalidis]|uniref:Uncharacterized protein n=1 Tax=Methylobacterium oxalidis TaxID=944322 RepID=A0A512J863_9HYPH|nr:hypothetical protein [Methylobacterium oxalidis]GEP06151.1 hypothetical protein MOX02_41890 [Methylobacterium oxalidis]GJE34585.1 hypothetical protein LDDCCGHA_4797 [Methylobacterium oxalidis]GLS65170.1 hypothetical protein GCM10007888_35520 [Methylobacterium oxalidis]
MPTLTHNPFLAALAADDAVRFSRRDRLEPRIAAAAGVLGRADYRVSDQRRAICRIIFAAALLAAGGVEEADLADLARALQRGRNAGGDGCERGHAANDFVRALLTAACLPDAEGLLRQLGTAVFMTADDSSRPEWAQVLRGAERFIDALETAQPRRVLRTTTALLRTAAGRPA